VVRMAWTPWRASSDLIAEGAKGRCTYLRHCSSYALGGADVLATSLHTCSVCPVVRKGGC